MKRFEIYERAFENTEETDPIHIHGYLEIFTLLEGQLDYMIDGVVYRMKEGDVAVVPPGAPHAKRITRSGYQRFAVINVERELFTESGLSDHFFSLGEREHMIGADSARESGLHNAFVRLADYTEGYRVTDTPIAACVVTEILYLIARGGFSCEHSENPTVTRILEYLVKHYGENITLEGIAKKLYLSKYYASRLFKAHTGMTVMEYLTRKRLYELERLVRSGSSMTEAALAVGFPSYGSFYTACKKAYGVSPREYLKRKE